MTDVVDKKTRSRMMSGIKGKNTKPELIVRSFLHSRGFRFSLHDKNLPGKPDIVLKKFSAVIQVNGCFWHNHGCKYFKWPKTRSDFWKKKIKRNVELDSINFEKLRFFGFRVCVIWECSLKESKNEFSQNLVLLIPWITGNEPYLEI